MSATVRLDTASYTALLDHLSAGELRNAIRRGVDQSARAARKATMPLIAKDVNVSAALLRASLPLVKASTQNDLSASWTIKKARVGIRNVWGVTLPTRDGSGLKASTFALTGGGSKSLSSRKAFVVTIGGNQIVMHRTGRGRAAIRAIYAASPVTPMSQTSAVPRKEWQRIASTDADRRIRDELQKAMDGQRISLSSGSASE